MAMARVTQSPAAPSKPAALRPPSLNTKLIALLVKISVMWSGSLLQVFFGRGFGLPVQEAQLDADRCRVVVLAEFGTVATLDAAAGREVHVAGAVVASQIERVELREIVGQLAARSAECCGVAHNVVRCVAVVVAARSSRGDRTLAVVVVLPGDHRSE